MKRTIIILTPILIVGALDSTRIYGDEPDWWSERDVTTSNPADDYAVANIGQLKNVATAAAAELNASLFSGAGDEINGLVAAWSEPPIGDDRDDYAAVNLGQLKTVAEPFYDRLIEVGYTTDYPWSGGDADDFALANLGQLKNVFSFDVIYDSDVDNLPD